MVRNLDQEMQAVGIQPIQNNNTVGDVTPTIKSLDQEMQSSGYKPLAQYNTNQLDQASAKEFEVPILPTLSLNPEASKGPILPQAPSVTGASTLSEGARYIANIPKSLYGQARGIVEFLNPINAYKSVQEAKQTFQGKGENVNAPQPSLTDVIGQVPQAMIDTFIPKIVKNFLSVGANALVGNSPEMDKALQETQRTLVNDPFNVLPAILMLRGVAEQTGHGELVDKALTDAAKPVLDIAKKTGEFAGKVAQLPGKIAEAGASQFTGLAPETLKTIVENPKAFTPDEMAQVSRGTLADKVKNTIDTRLEALSETGKEYQALRESSQTVNIPENTIPDVLRKFGIELDANDKIIKTAATTPMRPGDVSALQDFIDTFKRNPEVKTTPNGNTVPTKVSDMLNEATPSTNKTIFTANEFLNARKTLDMLYNKFDTNKSGVSKAIGASLRNAFDTYGKQQLNGLKELDTKFGPEAQLLRKAKSEYLNADGTLKDGAMNKLANLVGKGKDLALARLEKLSPGITQDIKILRAVEDVQLPKYGKIGTAFRVGADVLGYAAGGPIGTGIVELARMVLTQPSIMLPILRAFGEVKGFGNRMIDGIIRKMKLGLKLNPDEAGLVSGAIKYFAEKGKDILNKNIDVGMTVKKVTNLTQEDKTPLGAKIMATGEQKPTIQLKRDVTVTTLQGEKVTIPADEVLKTYEQGGKMLLKDGREYIVSKNQYQNIKGNALSGEAKPFAPELAGTEETVNVSNNVPQGLHPINPTKYSQYQLPGGKNYREIIIRAPEVKGQPTFESSHFPGEKNPISHLRVKEYDTKPYGQVTFMEELQSDWAREGRSKGFAIEQKPWTPETLPQGYEIFERNGVFNLTDSTGEVISSGKTKELALKSTNDRLAQRTGGVPNNPLLKNWQELSVKRALKEAVDNNSEYLAWISGEQTSARYNLATHLDEVKWNPSVIEYPDKTLYLKNIELLKPNGGKIKLAVDEKGLIKDTGEFAFKGKKLDEVLGKGLADSIMSKETGILSGDGLKFGGEWANNLYDKQVKNIVEDVTGGKVETLDMGLPIDNKTVSFSKPNSDAVLQAKDFKVGQEIVRNEESMGNKYIITDILGGGKFKAVPKNRYETIQKLLKENEFPRHYDNNLYPTRASAEKSLEFSAQAFDISTKKSAGQQGIRLTDDIKRMIRGEKPRLK